MTGPVNMVILGSSDNVGIALRDIAAGSRAQSIAGRALDALENIPQGHKIALGDIVPEASIVRCNMPVGVATAPIAMGTLVHVHNVASRYLNNDEDHYE